MENSTTGTNKQTVVYLAGKMGGRMGHDVLHERVNAARACLANGLTPIDPARGENIHPDEIVSLQLDSVTMRNFVAKDEWAIRHANVLLVLTGDVSSEGTGWEMGLAHFELKIPVVVVAPKRVAGKLMGFTNIKADAIFATVEEATKFIADNYAKDNQVPVVSHRTAGY